MRALLLDRLPNISTVNKAEVGKGLNGVKVNDAGMVQALLKYGTYDAYHYIREASENNKAASYDHTERLRALDLGTLELLRFRPPDELVLLTSSHHIAKFVPFRQFCRHPDWPICGLTHGLSANTLIPSYAWNYFAAFQSNDAIICTTRAGQMALASIFENLARSSSVAGVRSSLFPVQMPVIPLGIDIEDETSSPRADSARGDHGFVVLSIGRLSVSHKADLRPVIAAFLRADTLPDDSTLILAGDDTQSHIAQSLRQFAGRFASTRKVVVTPDISASMKSALLQMADVALCLTDTYQETFGLSVLEAMAAGLPVVAPSWNGYRDLVIHERTGFLVSTHGWTDTNFLNAVSMLVDPAFALAQRVVVDIEGIIHYLSLLARDKTRCHEMGMRARERARTFFSWRTVIHQYEDLWDKLTAKGKTLPTESSANLCGYVDYGKAFEAYPQAHVNRDSCIGITEPYQDLTALTNKVTQFSPPPIAGFSEELDSQILEICHRHRQLAVGDLLDRISTGSAGPSMAITQVGRLLKYGVLTMLADKEYFKEKGHEFSQHPTLCPVGL